MRRTFIVLLSAVTATVGFAALFAKLSTDSIAVEVPVEVLPEKLPDVAGMAEYAEHAKNTDERIRILLEINGSLVERLEELEGKMEVWRKAQSATYALQEQIFLRLETLSGGFVKLDGNVERDLWRPNDGYPLGPFVGDDENSDSIVEPMLPVQ